MAETPPVVPGSYGDARRRVRGAGEVTHAEAVPEPVGEAVSGVSGALRPPREGGGAPAGAELARAFQANADALGRLGQMQAEMMQALARNDRSEMMLASTQSLNETFRHLTLIQRELLGRLEHGVADTKRAGRAVPLLLLGLMAVVVLATYVIVDVARQAIDRNDPRAITEHAMALMQKEREEAAGDAEADEQRIRAELRSEEDKRRALEAQVDRERDERAEAQREVTLKDTELAGLRHQFTTAQTEALKVPSLESEIRDLASKVAVSEPRTRALQEELDEARRENNRLRKKIAGEALGFPADDPDVERPAPKAPEPTPPPNAFPPPAPVGATESPAPGPPPNGTVSAPAAPPAATPAAPPAPTPPAARETEGSRDPRVLADVRSRLNRMLDAAGSQRPEYWQVMRVDAVTLDRLKGVIVNRYDADARLIESVEAREAFVWVERDKRRVMLELRQGERVVGAARTPLPDGKFQAVLAEGEALTQVFAASGLRLIGSR
jgi:hypothetical protein